MEKSEPDAVRDPLLTSQSQHLGHLDGIRGLAALWVLVAHCMIWGGWYWKPFPNPKIAVDIFMCLSGYLMVHNTPLTRDNKAPSRRHLCHFYLRRFFRIAPVYYILLLVSFVPHQIMSEGLHAMQAANPNLWVPAGTDLSQGLYHPYYELSAANLATHLSFTFGLLPKYALSTFLPDWSIGLEMQFYVIFPLLIWLLRRYRYLIPLLVLVVLSFLVTTFLDRLPSPVAGSHTYYPEPSFLLLKLPLFLVGMLAAEAAQSFKTCPALSSVLSLMSMTIASLSSPYVAAVAAVMIFLGLAPAAKSAIPQTVQKCTELLNRALSNKFTRFLADASYSVYLVHGCFIAFFGYLYYTDARFMLLPPRTRVILLTSAVLVASYMISIILYHIVEKPGIRIGRRLTKSLHDTEAP